MGSDPNVISFMVSERTDHQVDEIASVLTDKNLTLVSAESCTGGLLAATFTDHPGCSGWYEGSFVTYRVSAKTNFLGIPEGLIAIHHPVSEEVAYAMAESALAESGADIAVSTTGLAGPDDDGTGVKIGTLWVAWVIPHLNVREARCFEIEPERLAFRRKAVELAIEGLWSRLNRG